MIHRVKGFGVVNKAEVDVFLELACFFCDPKDGGNLISGASASYKSNLNILSHCPSSGLERKLTFSSPVATVEFSKFVGILSAALSQYHLLGFEIPQLEIYLFI